jgi:amino acid permease
LVIGLLLLILTGLGTILSYLLLLKSAQITGCNSYESLSHNLFGFYFSIFVKLLIILGTIASLTAYMSVVASSLGKFIRQFLVDNSQAVFADPKVILAFALIIIIPLSLSKRINWLTWSSYVSILPLFYLLILEVVFFAMRASSGVLKNEADVPMAKGGIFVAMPIFKVCSCIQPSPSGRT